MKAAPTTSVSQQSDVPIVTLDTALNTLRAGGIVAFPTETVYGLGADALNPAAIAKVFASKRRPATNPLIVHVHSSDAARALTTAWPTAAQQLAEALWPGPITLVLPKANHIPAVITAGGPTVAIRIPNHPLALELLRQLDRPLVGPSANPSGTISPTTAQHVLESFNDTLPILDGGPCAAGIESTVYDPINHRLLRPGLITADTIARITHTHPRPGAQSTVSASAPTSPLPSPGLLPRHYAPRTPALLVTTDTIPTLLAGTRRAIILATSPQRLPSPHTLIQMPPGPRDYAQRLYDALHQADHAAADLILIERPTSEGPDAELWLAILDRLTRATTPA